MPRGIKVASRTIADRIQLAYLKKLGEVYGLPVGTGGYTGMAGVANGQLAPPGQGESLSVLPERELADGSLLLVVEDADEQRRQDDPRKVFRPRDVAGTRVDGTDVPAREDVPERDIKPPPDNAPQAARGRKP